MNDLNQIMIIGRLTRDAELKYTAGGLAISNFSIAVNRRRKSGEQWVDEVSYFDVSLFGKSAENLNQYLIKGKQVGIQGELRQDRWEQDGQNRSKVFIVALNVQLLGGNSGGSAGMMQSTGGGYSQNRSQQSYQQHSPNVQNQQQYSEYDAGQSYGGDSDFPEEIPF
ncbi:MAG: single-stranded DNA-binding protein [Treponema sp.]|jgi:single-strand DNA-binding protein|nr:single-stranded DNA-binding protein [Treponema sp.]